jgi:hypothetical protein
MIRNRETYGADEEPMLVSALTLGGAAVVSHAIKKDADIGKEVLVREDVVGVR